MIQNVTGTLRMLTTAIVALILFSRTAAAEDPLRGANLSKHVAGPELKPGDLDGKVVLVEYFIFGCKPCRNSLPLLVKALQAQAANDNFAVVISVQSKVDDEGRKYLEKHAPSIPIYREMNLPHAKSTKGYPNGHLIDHRGEVVASGGPDGLLKKVNGLVAAVPGLEPTPLLIDFPTRECAADVAALRDPKKDGHEVLLALQATAREENSAAAEAKDIVSRTRKWLDAERARLEFVAKRRPAEVAWQAQELLARFEDFDRKHDEQLRKILSEVKYQPGVLRYLEARKDFLLARTNEDEELAAGFHKRACVELEAVLNDEKAPKSVKDAAEGLRREYLNGQ